MLTFKRIFFDRLLNSSTIFPLAATYLRGTLTRPDSKLLKLLRFFDGTRVAPLTYRFNVKRPV